MRWHWNRHRRGGTDSTTTPRTGHTVHVWTLEEIMLTSAVEALSTGQPLNPSERWHYEAAIARSLAAAYGSLPPSPPAAASTVAPAYVDDDDDDDTLDEEIAFSLWDEHGDAEWAP